MHQHHPNHALRPRLRVPSALPLIDELPLYDQRDNWRHLRRLVHDVQQIVLHSLRPRADSLPSRERGRAVTRATGGANAATVIRVVVANWRYRDYFIPELCEALLGACMSLPGFHAKCEAHQRERSNDG